MSYVVISTNPYGDPIEILGLIDSEGLVAWSSLGVSRLTSDWSEAIQLMKSLDGTLDLSSGTIFRIFHGGNRYDSGTISRIPGFTVGSGS